MSGPAARTPTPAQALALPQDPPYPTGHNRGGRPTLQPPSGECVQKFCGVHLLPPKGGAHLPGAGGEVCGCLPCTKPHPTSWVWAVCLL